MVGALRRDILKPQNPRVTDIQMRSRSGVVEVSITARKLTRNPYLGAQNEMAQLATREVSALRLEVVRVHLVIAVYGAGMSVRLAETDQPHLLVLDQEVGVVHLQPAVA